MVDVDRLLSIIARITARLRILDEYAATDPEELLGDRVRMGDLKYTFQTALEAAIDGVHHVIASEGLAVPATNADAFRPLADADLLTTELADTMAAAAGFRNVLVHGYAEVDDQRVVENLDRIPELRAYVAALTALLDTDEP